MVWVFISSLLLARVQFNSRYVLRYFLCAVHIRQPLDHEITQPPHKAARKEWTMAKSAKTKTATKAKAKYTTKAKKGGKK